MPTGWLLSSQPDTSRDNAAVPARPPIDCKAWRRFIIGANGNPPPAARKALRCDRVRQSAPRCFLPRALERLPARLPDETSRCSDNVRACVRRRLEAALESLVEL